MLWGSQRTMTSTETDTIPFNETDTHLHTIYSGPSTPPTHSEGLPAGSYLWKAENKLLGESIRGPRGKIVPLSLTQCR